LGPSARRIALTQLISTLTLTGAPSVAAERVSIGLEGKPASPVILLLGDSWSAEYGLRRGKGWVALLEQRLSERPEFGAFTLVNASISGETTAGGLSRLPALLEKHQPRVLLIALGGNDGLRGLSLENARTQLSAMIDRGKAAGAQVLLIGMRLPPNYGRYAKDFEALFAALARQKNVPLVPFLMAGIEEDITKFQADRIHPTESAQAHMLDQAWPSIEQLLKRSSRK
jgi:acyl-CoA thioesterase-1